MTRYNLPKTNNKTKNPHISLSLGFSKCCKYTLSLTNKKLYMRHHHPDDQVLQHLVYTLWNPNVKKYVKNIQNVQLIFQVIKLVCLT